MPPRIKVKEDEILNAAMRIVQKKGFEHLNVRDVAREIGCSVHPIFRTFESMEGLRAAVYKKVEQMYNERMLNALQHGKYGFLGMGLAYIDFARSEQNLFKLLFMSDAFHGQSILDIVGAAEEDEEVIRMLCQMTGLSAQSSKELFAGIWLTTHGIAVMFATNSCRFSEDEIRRLLSNASMGLKEKLKQEEVK